MLIDEKDLKKSVLRLAIPAVMEQVLVMVVGVISTMLVGRLGKEALSAVGIVNQTIAFILVLSTALSTGSTVLVARLIGEGKRNDARDAMRQSGVLGTAAFVVVAVICRLFAEQIVGLFFGAAEAESNSWPPNTSASPRWALPFLLVNTSSAATCAARAT